MPFQKAHGLVIAQNGHIKNMTVETLSNTDESGLTLSAAMVGRVWYNSDLNQLRTVRDDGTGGQEIISLIGSASGSAGITIQDEGGQIATGVETLNFVGADIRAMDGGGSVVNIYAPPPVYPNHYNDGSAADTGFTPCSISDVSPDDNRKIATLTTDGTPYYHCGWADGANHPIVATSKTSYVYNSPGTANVLFDTNSSSITATVYTGSGTGVDNVAAQAVLSSISGADTVTSQGITVTVSNWSAQFDKYKADIDVTFDISALLGAGQTLENGGRFKLEIKHTDDGSDYIKSQEFFMDDGQSSAISGTVSIAENTATTKYISGVMYYANGTQWDVSVTGVDNLNTNTYEDPLLSLAMSDYGLGSNSVDRADSTWTGLTTDYDNTGASFAYSPTMSNATFRKIGSAQISATPLGGNSGSAVSSTATNVLIDGYGTTSTRYAEEFNNEAERLVNNGASAPTSGWSSSSAIGSTDLFIQDGTLKRIPTIDYSTGWAPTSNTASYTSNTSDQVYIREFRTNNLSKVNGLVEIGGTGVTESAVIAEDVILEVSTDGTTWGKINDSTDYRIDKTIYNLNETGSYKRIRFGLGAVNGNSALGGVDGTTGLSGWGMFFRVTIPNGSSVEVDYIRVTDWA